jgi:hypothetical protein
MAASRIRPWSTRQHLHQLIDRLIDIAPRDLIRHVETLLAALVMQEKESGALQLRK